MNQLPVSLSVAFLTFFVPAGGSTVATDELASQRELARQRYERVLSELARADLSGMNAEQRAARSELLAALAAYVQRADFGIQREDPGARIPKFVDDEGRRCAMAELLHVTGEDELVTAVRAANNEAWIAELSGNPTFVDWLDANGLTLLEAARIQGPPLGGPRGVPFDSPPAVPPPAPRGGTKGAGAASRPADTGPSASAPAPSTGGAAGPSATPQVSTDPWLEEDTAAWWQWWEYNKIEYLRPNRLAPDREQMSEDAGRTFVSQMATVRRTLLPSLLRALDHSDARVRAVAAVAAGRAGGEQAVEPLLERLSDASVEVREMAILGLGSTGAPDAQALLVELAREGRIGRGESLGHRARALAIVALGIGRKVGFDASVDGQVAAIADDRRAAEKEPLGVAAMTYALLSPSPVLAALARELATDSSEPVAVRCRAIEALRGNTDAETLATMQHLLSGSRVETRRSAALALGEFAHPLVTAALMTAHDLENEQLTRGFLLVALGRQGGDAAREYLMDALEDGKGMERPWAALALGLAARAEPDPRATRALREGAATEKRAADRGAYWLALGLARDTSATEMLTEALVRSTDPTSRMYAAQALAMLRTDEARDSLLASIGSERSSIARSQIALALGILGEPGDVDPIAQVLAQVSAPELQGQVASAMAFHGSTEALHRLGQLCMDEQTPDAERAASVDALGMLMSRVAPLAFGEATRSSNFTMFDDWLAQAATTTL